MFNSNFIFLKQFESQVCLAPVVGIAFLGTEIIEKTILLTAKKALIFCQGLYILDGYELVLFLERSLRKS